MNPKNASFGQKLKKTCSNTRYSTQPDVVYKQKEKLEYNWMTYFCSQHYHNDSNNFGNKQFRQVK